MYMDKNKYWLPDGVILKPNQEVKNRRQKLIFIDIKYGEFNSRFEQLQKYGYSTHPKRQKNRYKKTVDKRSKIIEKTCTKCKICKPVSEFFKAGDRSNGYKSHCKECINKYRQQSKYKSITKKNRKSKKWKEYQQNYRKNNKNKLQNYYKEYRNNNKDVISVRNREYRIKKRSSKLNITNTHKQIYE